MTESKELLRKDLAEVKTPFISDSTYEFLRNNVEIVLPAIGVAYAGLAILWGWPFSEQIVGTLGIIGILFGTVIKVNKKRATNVQTVVAQLDAIEKAEADADRYAGNLILGTGDEQDGLLTVALDKELSEIANQSEVLLRVKNIGLSGI
jgi:hypothetical protein